jgi:hypothetical protein
MRLPLAMQTFTNLVPTSTPMLVIIKNPACNLKVAEFKTVQKKAFDPCADIACFYFCKQP